ncbi:hypothetical protein ACGF0D_10470 [Kitasatospora sp. NPDC048298]|uniref:hypothetical protein n=1 Tax=Kitasatospora sp. NPDC048298 TaxID=3364049 RepID=UPI00372158E6
MADELPVRREMAAEVPLMERYMDAYGDDPWEWPAAVVHQHAAEVARLRERWLRGEVQ